MENNPQCIVMDIETYLSINNASRQDIGDSALHKNKGNNSDKTWAKIVNRQLQKDIELCELRDKLRNEYNEKVLKGEIRPPTRIEKLISIAKGHSDNESVQAARRILSKNNINW